MDSGSGIEGFQVSFGFITLGFLASAASPPLENLLRGSSSLSGEV